MASSPSSPCSSSSPSSLSSASSPSSPSSPYSPSHSPWTSLLSLGFLSDVTVQVAGNPYHLHRFPLFARSEFFKDRCQEARDSCHVFIDLPTLPGGLAAFRHVTLFCYSDAPPLDPSVVLPILLAAEYFRMTDEYSPHNLIGQCEDFLKKEVYTCWENAFTVLEKAEEAFFEEKRSKEVLKACQEVVVDYASKLDDVIVTSMAVKFFHRLVTLPHALAQDLLNYFKESTLTFVKLGNFLAKENHTWVLSKFVNVERTAPELLDDGHADKDIINLKNNIHAILSFLVCSLYLYKDKEISPLMPQYDNAYIVTLLMCSSRLRNESCTNVLEEVLGKRLPSLTLEDLQALDVKSVESIFSHYFEKNVKGRGRSPSEELLSLGVLLDQYLYWASSHCKDFGHPFLNLLEVFPREARGNCDMLYDAIDKLIELNPRINDSDQIRLCGYLEPLKISEFKAEHALQNGRMRLQQNFISALYWTQKKRLAVLETNLKRLQEEVGEIKEEGDKVQFKLKPVKRNLCNTSKLALSTDGKLWTGWDSLGCWEGDKCQYITKDRHSTIFSLSVSEDRILWAGCEDGKIMVVANRKVMATVKGHIGYITSLVATFGRRCFSACGREIKEWVWDGKLIHCFSSWNTGWGHTVNAICKDKRGRIWSVSTDAIQCWENSTNTRVVRIKEGSVPAFTKTTNMDRIVAGNYVWTSGGKIIFCWTLDGEYVHHWEAHDRQIWALAIGKDGVLWSTSADKSIRAWRGPWKRVVRVTLFQTEDMCLDLAAVPDGSVWAAFDSKVILLKREHESL